MQAFFLILCYKSQEKGQKKYCFPVIKTLPLLTYTFSLSLSLTFVSLNHFHPGEVSFCPWEKKNYLGNTWQVHRYSLIDPADLITFTQINILSHYYKRRYSEKVWPSSKLSLSVLWLVGWSNHLSEWNNYLCMGRPLFLSISSVSSLTQVWLSTLTSGV